jgi:cyclophilin family peptidyl-prolyl cis-trans isomerase
MELTLSKAISLLYTFGSKTDFNVTIRKEESMKKQMNFILLASWVATVCFLSGCLEQEKAAEESPEVKELIEHAAIEPEIEEPAPVTLPSPAQQGPINPVVKMTTSMGVIQIELYPEKAPVTVGNFLGYVKDGFYDGTIFHRVINRFMIQGGGFTEGMKQKPTRPAIVNECGPELRNLRGTIAMARTSAPNSATCQFFINQKDNPALDFDGPNKPGYAVFGKVIEGMDVVDRIATVQTMRLPTGMGDVPVQPIVIQKVEQMR